MLNFTITTNYDARNATFAWDGSRREFWDAVRMVVNLMSEREAVRADSPEGFAIIWDDEDRCYHVCNWSEEDGRPHCNVWRSFPDGGLTTSWMA